MNRRILAGAVVMVIVIAGCTNTEGDPATTTVTTTSAPATTAPTTTVPPATTATTTTAAPTTTAPPSSTSFGIEPTVVTTSFDDSATITLTTRDGVSISITFPFEATTAHNTRVYSAPDHPFAIVAMSSLWLLDRYTHEFEQLQGPQRMEWFQPSERFAVTSGGGRVQVIDLAVGTVIDVGRAFKFQYAEVAGHRVAVHLFDESPAVAVVDADSGNVVTISADRAGRDGVSDTGELLAVGRMTAGSERIAVSSLADPGAGDIWFESDELAGWAWEGDKLLVATEDGELHLVDGDGHESIGVLDMDDRDAVFLFGEESAPGIVANVHSDDGSEWFFIDVEQGSVMPIAEASGMEKMPIDDPGYVVVIEDRDATRRVGAIRLRDGQYTDLEGLGDRSTGALGDGNGGVLVFTAESAKLVHLESGREFAIPGTSMFSVIGDRHGTTVAYSFAPDGVWTTRLYEMNTGEPVGDLIPGIVVGWL